MLLGDPADYQPARVPRLAPGRCECENGGQRVGRTGHDHQLQGEHEPEVDQEARKRRLFRLEAFLDDVQPGILHVLAGQHRALGDEHELRVLVTSELLDAFLDQNPDVPDLVLFEPPLFRADRVERA